MSESVLSDALYNHKENNKHILISILSLRFRNIPNELAKYVSGYLEKVPLAIPVDIQHELIIDLRPYTICQYVMWDLTVHDGDPDWWDDSGRNDNPIMYPDDTCETCCYHYNNNSVQRLLEDIEADELIPKTFKKN